MTSYVYRCNGCRRLDFTDSPYLDIYCCNTRMNYFRMEWKMNNLEWMHHYEGLKQQGFIELTREQLETIAACGTVGLSVLTNEQIISFIDAIDKLTQIGRIATQLGEHTLRERGIERKRKTAENDSRYVVPSETQLEQIERKMSKKGESAGSISVVKEIVNMDWDKILGD